MKNYRYTIITAFIAIAGSMTAQTATESTAPVTTVTYQIGVGPTKILDTYLSNEHFSGTGLTFMSTVERRKPTNKWTTLLEHQANISKSNDREDMVDELEGSYNLYLGRLYTWNLLNNRLTLQAGGMGNAYIGFIYNMANGNNPAQARLAVNIMPTGIAKYRFTALKRKMSLRYEMQLPIAGIMFSPNYGQSYYEIFSRGNYDNNIVPTTFVTAPNFRQQLSLDINMSRRYTLRIGYLGDWQQAKVNNLKSHIYSHRLMLGIAKKFQLISYRP